MREKKHERRSLLNRALRAMGSPRQGPSSLPSTMALIDAQAAHIAIIDENGWITQTNDAWRSFWDANGGGAPREMNYLDVCEHATGQCSEEAKKTADLIRRVLSGESKYETITYACHSPSEQRWYRAEVSPIRSDCLNAIVVHHDISDQVLAHNRLQSTIEHQSLLSRVVEVTTNAVVVTDERGLIKWVNQGFTRVSGYTLEEVVGKSPGAFLQNEKTDQATVRAIREALHARRGFRGEILNVGKHGQEYWIDIDITPQFDGFGNLVGFMAIETDITQSKNNKLEYQKLAKRLETATSGGGIGVWELDPGSGELIWDQSMHTMYGTDPEHDEVTFELRASSVHPADLDKTSEMVTGSIETGERFETTFRLLLPSGEIKHIRASAIMTQDESGHGRRMIGINEDITEIQEAKLRLELTLEASGAGLWDWHVQQKQFYSNATFFTMLGEDPIEGAVHESEFMSRVHEDDFAAMEQSVERAFSDPGAPYDVEFRLRRADGSYIWTRSIGRVIERDEHGAPIRMIGQHLDIDAQVRAREQIERLNDELRAESERAKRLALEAQQASEAKSSFLANMSHEIRTPMTAMLGFTELLEQEVEGLDPGTIEHIQTIRRNGEHLLQVINDILDISKIEAGEMRSERVVSDVSDIVREAVALHSVRAERAGIALGCEISSSVPTHLMIDPVRLRQVVMNLLGNAVKFTEQGSVNACVTYDERHDRLAVEIRDTGIGIEHSKIGSLFDAFTQADESTTRRFGGTGLGLRISKRLAELMGGDIRVESEPGIGSSFTLEIHAPRSEQQVVHKAPVLKQDAAPSSAQPLEGVRVLLIEDGPDNQKLISHHLKKAGASVEIAENGRVGVERLSDGGVVGAQLKSDPGFDLIISDMQMPEMDGYTAVKLLRQGGCTLPIIALTAHAMSGDREKCINAGCDDYLAKPIKKSELVERCLAHLQRLGRDAA